MTLDDYRVTAWSLLEFLRESTGADPPIGRLSVETAPQWLDWLRTTFHYRRKRGAYPRHITPQSVAAFFAWPAAKKVGETLRGPATIAKRCREGSTILRWLGVPVEIARRKRRKFRRLPPIVPKLEAISARFQRILAADALTLSQRRQIVLTQALVLLWGARIHEALAALLDDMEGHWLLVGGETMHDSDAGKTGMRLSYLNSQALGIVQALRGQTAWEFAAQRHTRVAGWPWGISKWHHDVRACGLLDDARKPQQDLRKRFTTWVHAQDAEVEMLLAGHGGGVIFDHYLDVLERVPGVMEQFSLAAIEGFSWPQPVYVHQPAGFQGTWGPQQEAVAAAAETPPRRLYARFDAWLAEREREAAE